MTKQYPKISRVTGSQVAALAKVDAAVVSKILKEDPTHLFYLYLYSTGYILYNFYQKY